MRPTQGKGRTRPVVAVIGGSSGIGLGVAQAMLAVEADVVVVGRSKDRLAAAADQLGRPERLRTVVADITDDDQVRDAFAGIGGLDHVVVTAVDPVYGTVAGLAVADIRRLIDSKLVGAMLVAKHAGPFVSPEGSITFTGGIAADRPAAGGATVAAVNAGLVGLTGALALELAPVRVNLLSPGWVDTPVWDTIAGADKAARLAAMAERLPAGRVGTPADIAQAVLYVTSAPFLTAAVIPVDGGQRLV